MLRAFFTIIITLFIIYVFAQKQRIIDSLKSVIADVEDNCDGPCLSDTVKMVAYLEWGELIYTKDPDSALILWQKAKDIANACIQSKDQSLHTTNLQMHLASALNNIGYIYKFKTKYAEALQYYKESYLIRKKIDDKKGMASSLNNIGIVYRIQGDIDKALDSYNKSLYLREKTGDIKGMAYNYNSIGKLYNKTGNIPKALYYYNKSLEIRIGMEDKKGLVASFVNIGLLYQNQGEIAKAMDCYLKCIAICEEIEDRIILSKSYNNIAMVYYNLGNISKSLEYFDKSLLIKKELGDKEGISTVFNNIGYIYYNQGNVKNALEYYNKSLAIRKETGNEKGTATLFNNLGSLYIESNDTLKALEYFNKSLNIREKIGDKSGFANSLNNIGYIYYEDHQFIKALNYFNKSLIIREEMGNNEGIASSMFNIGNVYLYKSLQDGKYLQKLEEFANRGYNISMELKFPSKMQNSAALMRNYYVLTNNFNDADRFAKEILQSINRTVFANFATLSESGQEKFYSTLASDYMDFYSYCLFRKETNSSITDYAYNITLQNKGLLLKSSTALRNNILNSKDTVLIDNYYKWLHLKKQIAKKYSTGQTTDSLEKLANKYETELVKYSKIFSNYNNLKQSTWKNVQKSLKPGEAAIEFVHFNFKDYTKDVFWEFTDSILYCALVLTPESKHPEMIPLFEENELQDLLSQYEGNNYQYISKLYGSSNTHKRELYDLIWKPLENTLEGINTVYLSPSGLLHKISFAALAINHNVYLCDKYKIQMKSSTSCIVYPETTFINKNMSTTIFGGVKYSTDSTQYELWKYLNGTKTETEKIEKLFSSHKLQVHYYTNENASEEEFKEIASNSNILHISTHGFFFPDPVNKTTAIDKNDTSYQTNVSRNSQYRYGYAFVKQKNPLMRSGLVLAGGNNVWNNNSSYNYDQEDGILTAQEVSNIDLRNTDLVVMSACETGLGDVKGSEGVYGLQRAFKIAGAKYIIMSLWQIADKETEEFMTGFYTHLLDIKNVNEAFTRAQQEMKQKYDPYYWAAFVLIE